MSRWSEAWLRAEFRPNDVLTEGELRAGRETRFLQLCAQQLQQLCPDREPFVAEIFGARRIAESIWKFDRLTGDRFAQDLAYKRVDRNLARAEHFAEAEFRARLSRNLAEDIRDVQDFLELATPRLDVEEQPQQADNVARLA